MDTHGDFPVAALRGVAKLQVNPELEDGRLSPVVAETATLRMLAKNVHSIQSDIREKEFLEETELSEWDFVVMSETWRETKEEIWRMGKGHLFLGAGGMKGQRGVAIVVNRRHTCGFKAFHAVNERICALDINVRGEKRRIISVYIPDGSYGDAEVEEAYLCLSLLHARGKQLKRSVVMAGDWNAVVGLQKGGEDDTAGMFGMGMRNQRGEWMVNWATSRRLSVVNTYFEKDLEEQWTYINDGRKRQLDFFLVERQMMARVLDAQATDEIGVGLDHRTIMMDIAINIGPRRVVKRDTARRRSNKGWAPADDDEYKDQFGRKLKHLRQERWNDWIGMAAEEKCKAIEQVLLESAELHRTMASQCRTEEKRSSIQALIEDRRAARKNGAREQVKVLSKQMAPRWHQGTIAPRAPKKN